MMCIGAVYQLEKFLKNPLVLGYQFYMDEYGVNGYAEHPERIAGKKFHCRYPK